MQFLDFFFDVKMMDQPVAFSLFLILLFISNVITWVLRYVEASNMLILLTLSLIALLLPTINYITVAFI
jgi:hypothetical protein